MLQATAVKQTQLRQYALPSSNGLYLLLGDAPAVGTFVPLQGARCLYDLQAEPLQPWVPLPKMTTVLGTMSLNASVNLRAFASSTRFAKRAYQDAWALLAHLEMSSSLD